MIVFVLVGAKYNEKWPFRLLSTLMTNTFFNLVSLFIKEFSGTSEK